MTRVEYESRILEVLEELEYEENLLEKWQEKSRVLREFSKKCIEKANSFDNSMQKRKRKVNSIEHLVSRVKSILKYRNGMDDLLNGSNYKKVKKQIEDMLEKNAKKEEELSEEIRDIETRIRRLKQRLEQLRDELKICIAEEQKGEV